MSFFAEPSHQKTTGARGKTTRRKSTKTVRGNDGAYCAMIKEELGPKVEVTRAGFRVFDTAVWPKSGATASSYSQTFKTREDAERYAARLQTISGTDAASGWVYTTLRVEETTYTETVYTRDLEAK